MSKQRRRYSLCAIIIFVASFVHTYTSIIFDLHQSQFPLEGSRRLTETDPKVKSRFESFVQFRPWLDPPPPILTGKVWNATNVQWFGNSFRFSTHIKDTKPLLYTPHQIQKAFRHHSILLQGDSTFRRLYGTLHGVLDYDVWTGSTTHFPKGFPSQVPNPPFGIPETYFVRRGLDVPKNEIDQEAMLSLFIHSPSPIDPRILDHRTIIDVNKEFHTEPCHRVFPPARKSSHVGVKVCRPHPTGGWIPPRMVNLPLEQQHHNPTQLPLLYDYIGNNCLGDIYDFVSNELITLKSITRHYTMYIVGSGVWETVKQTACHHPIIEKLHSEQVQWPDSLYQLLHMTLENLSKLADQSPNLLIIWRTSGYYDGDERSYVIKEMNRLASVYIDDWNKSRKVRGEGKKSNFLSIDFGSAIESRSHGKQRLRGDMQAHYGLGARILQVQMLTNLLYEYGHVN